MWRFSALGVPGSCAEFKCHPVFFLDTVRWGNTRQQQPLDLLGNSQKAIRLLCYQRLTPSGPAFYLIAEDTLSSLVIESRVWTPRNSGSKEKKQKRFSAPSEQNWTKPTAGDLCQDSDELINPTVYSNQWYGDFQNKEICSLLDS